MEDRVLFKNYRHTKHIAHQTRMSIKKQNCSLPNQHLGTSLSVVQIVTCMKMRSSASVRNNSFLNTVHLINQIKLLHETSYCHHNSSLWWVHFSIQVHYYVECHSG